MRKFFFLCVFAICSQALSAQITLTPVVEATTSGLNANAVQIAKGRIRSIISSNGMVSSNGSRFLLACKVAALSQSVAGTKLMQHLQVTMAIGDNISNHCFGAVTFNTGGVGNTPAQAMTRALASINGNNPQLQELIANSKKRIIDFYNENGPSIIKKARALLAGQDWEGAIYELSAIPNEANCYNEAASLLKTVYEENINHDAAQVLAEARAVWSSDPNPGPAADKAMEILSGINTSAKCYPQAKALMQRIENRIKNVTDTKVRNEKELERARINADVALEKARLQGIRSIAEAYAKQRTVVYRYNSWW